MNYLAHAFLARPDSAHVCGALIGDFAKGIAVADLPAAIRVGVEWHRRVDRLTDTHPVVRHARERFPPAQRRFSGIVLDVVFDHFLARDFAVWCDQPLRDFTASVYRALDEHSAHLPERLARIRGSMTEHDWLASYAGWDDVGRALAGISRRMRHANPLAAMMPSLAPIYRDLESDFRAFFPDLIRDAAQPPAAW